MYSTVRKLSVLCVILSFFNAIATVMLITYLWGLTASFGLVFFGSVYLATSTVIMICVIISLRSLARDLELEYDSNAATIHKLTVRIRELESKP